MQRGSISLAEYKPSLASEWDFEKNGALTPNKVSYGSHKKVWWLCKEHKHSWESVIKVRALRGDGCPICSNKKLLVGYNDLQHVRPDIAEEWHKYKNGNEKPVDYVFGARAKVWWECSICEHEWKQSISHRTLTNNSCPKCNSAHGTSFMEQALYYYMKTIFPDAKNRSYVNDVEADIYIPSKNIVIEYDGWYHTDNLYRDLEKNLAFSKTILIRVRISTLPEVEGCYNIFTQGTQSDMRGIIESIREVFSENNITTKAVDIDIPRDRKQILANMSLPEVRSSLGELYPQLIEEWDYDKNEPLTPFNVSYGSNEKVWWLCKEHKHSWKAIIKHRTGNSSGCVVCSNRVIKRGFNDLATTHPLIAEEWDYESNDSLTPYLISRGSQEKVNWVCEKGHRFKTSISQRTGKTSVDCPKCNKDVIAIGVLTFRNKVVGVRFQWGKRYVDVDYDTLNTEGIKLDLQGVQEIPLLEYKDKLVTEIEINNRIYVGDYSSNLTFLKILIKNYG